MGDVALALCRTAKKLLLWERTKIKRRNLVIRLLLSLSTSTLFGFAGRRVKLSKRQFAW